MFWVYQIYAFVVHKIYFLTLRLIAVAQPVIFLISADLVLTVTAGTLRYVSSAYLHSSLPSSIVRRSDALARPICRRLGL